MRQTVTAKLIESHLVEGEVAPGAEIALRIDQTLTQDATGTLVMLELEAMGLDRVRTEVSVQYVDHNLLQADYRERRRPPVPAPRLPAVRRLVLPTGQRRQPPGAHAALRQAGQDAARL